MNKTSLYQVNILDSFDGRLLKLEASILPIHKSTQNLTKLANSNSAQYPQHPTLWSNSPSIDIDATLKETENIVDCLNMPSKEEAYILKGYTYMQQPTHSNWFHTCSPDENNVLPYLKAMGRLKDGVDAIEKSQLRSCEKTTYQMVIRMA